MVHRTIGDKFVPDGSSGREYLESTLGTMPFPDLWAIRRRL
jgi:tryptophan 2,3-dioxygenase